MDSNKSNLLLFICFSTCLEKLYFCNEVSFTIRFTFCLSICGEKKCYSYYCGSLLLIIAKKILLLLILVQQKVLPHEAFNQSHLAISSHNQTKLVAAKDAIMAENATPGVRTEGEAVGGGDTLGPTLEGYLALKGHKPTTILCFARQ